MPNAAAVAPVSTTSGWFGGFKLQADFQSLQLLGETPGEDEKATEECPEGGRMLTEDNDYTWIKFSILIKGVSIIKTCFKGPVSQRQESKLQDFKPANFDDLPPVTSQYLTSCNACFQKPTSGLFQDKAPYLL